MADAFGALRFGGVDFGALGDPPGTGPVGDGFSPDGDCLGPGVLGAVGLTAGKAPGVPVGLTPIRFGGTNFFVPAGAFGEPAGVALTVGTLSPGLTVGLTRLGGICLWPITGEPVGLGDPIACPFLRICGVGNGVGFGRSFGGGFC
jgi:hypothetical protein